MGARKVAVVGGGWAGCAAAVQAVEAGHEVTLFEMAGHLGGRARRVELDGTALDNGQHILIGAYGETLALMRRVGVAPDEALLRMPLRVMYPDGSGLLLAEGPALRTFPLAVLRYPGWSARERLALLAAAGGWALRGFGCRAGLSVSQLCAALPQKVRADFIEPLCVAALNTPAREACAQVFLRVLRDALFSGPGSSDLLLPRSDLSALLPDAAARWLEAAGATLRLSRRVQRLEADAGGWRVDGERFDAVVLAASPVEAARLVAPIDAGWAAQARALRFEPIVTVYAQADGATLPLPMMALREGPGAPAQFVFDHGRLGGPAGRLAFVVSGASGWLARGSEATAQAVLAQAREVLPAGTAPRLRLLRTLVEKRATFLCTPGLARPPAAIAPGLQAAGDYVAGPYPATLEGAVRSGKQAARALT
nr:hydroxysqualene dehydroxylase HpnE [Caldimonas tepidiphila]